MSTELSVITKAKDLCDYVLTVTDKSPKKYRFTLVNRLQNYSLDALEAIIAANDVLIKEDGLSEAKRRRELQQKAMTSLKTLGFMSEIAMRKQCILPKQYEQITGKISETQRLLTGWMNSDKKRYDALGLRL